MSEKAQKLLELTLKAKILDEVYYRLGPPSLEDCQRKLQNNEVKFFFGRQIFVNFSNFPNINLKEYNKINKIE